jgi:hypothetical protein
LSDWPSATVGEDTGNDHRQGAGVDRLGDVAVASRLPGLLLVSLHGVRGERQDGDVARRGVFLQAPGQGQAVHAWQLQVHEDEPRMEAVEHRQGLLGIHGHPHLVALAGKHHARQLEVGRVVVDDQDRLTGHVAAPRRPEP